MSLFCFLYVVPSFHTPPTCCLPPICLLSCLIPPRVLCLLPPSSICVLVVVSLLSIAPASCLCFQSASYSLLPPSKCPLSIVLYSVLLLSISSTLYVSPFACRLLSSFSVRLPSVVSILGRSPWEPSCSPPRWWSSGLPRYRPVWPASVATCQPVTSPDMAGHNRSMGRAHAGREMSQQVRGGGCSLVLSSGFRPPFAMALSSLSGTASVDIFVRAGAKKVKVMMSPF